MADEISYRLEKFEGPLDLLLHLIEKNRINIYDIPISEITEQYMSYMAGMDREDLDLMSEFLLMAATLLEIKARMLLPREKDAETGEEEDPRAELVERLLEYRKYRLMAAELSDREFDAERILYREPSVPKEVAAWTPPVDLDALFGDITLVRLQKIFAEVMRQQEDREDTRRSRFGTIRRDPVSLKKQVEMLLGFAKEHTSFSFRELLKRSRSRTETVVTFLAVLELMKAGKLRASQNGPDDDISIETDGQASGGTMDLSGMEDFGE